MQDSGSGSGNSSQNGSAQSSINRRAASQQITAPMPPPTDFERYVQASTGQSLRIFGLDYFRNRAAADLAETSNVAAPADFVVGPNDQIRVRTSGAISLDLLATVDRNGYIFLPDVGTIQIGGSAAERGRVRDSDRDEPAVP